VATGSSRLSWYRRRFDCAVKDETKADAKSITKMLAKTGQYRDEYTGELTKPSYRALEQTLTASRERDGQQDSR